MERKKQFYVYLTTNLINNKQYIGQHYGYIDDKYIGSGDALKIDIKEYGKENFKKEILEIVNNYDELNIAEKKWIDHYNAVKDKNFYNIASGGYGSNPFAGKSEEEMQEIRKKQSINNSGEKNYFYGRHLFGEDSYRWGTHHTEESKAKMREAKKDGKAPTARGVAIYDLEGNFIREFETQRLFKIFLGLSPNGSTDTLRKYIENNKPYHNYIVKYID